MREDPEVMIARVQKAGIGVKILNLLENTRCVSEYGFDSLILGNGMLRSTSNFLTSMCTRAGRPIKLSYRAFSSF